MSTPRVTLAESLTVAASLAVAAGVVEAVVVAFKRHVLGRIVFVSPDYWLLTPVAFVVIAVPVALAVAFAFWAIRKPISVAVFVGTVTGFLAFAILLPYTAIGWWASAILTTGLAIRIVKSAARVPSPVVVSLVRRAGLTAAALAVIVGGFTMGSRVVAERRASLATPSPKPDAPNVLLVVLDTVRASNLSLHGYERRTTPNLETLAATSTVFDRAISTAPWTLPSHASLFTGLSGGETGGDWLHPIRSDVPTLPEAFSGLGYSTAGFVSNLLYTSYESGVNRGFVHYDDYRWSWPLVLAHTPLSKLDIKSRVPEARSFMEAISRLHTTSLRTRGLSPADEFRGADKIVAAFLDWQASSGDRPFFAFLNLFDAHGPYRAPPNHLNQFPGGRPLDRYDAAIAFLDEALGRLTEELARRQVLDKTILIVTSDHGELFDEHGLKGHANGLYLPLIHVPLLVRFPPAVPAGQRVPTIVSIRDLPATLVELAGVSAPGIPGQSLSPTWRQPGGGIHGDVVASLGQGRNVDPSFRNARGPMISRLSARLHFIINGDGSEEVYDFRADPAELNNLVASADPALQKEIALLRQGLQRR